MKTTNKFWASLLLTCASGYAGAENIVIVGEFVSVRPGPCEFVRPADGECSQSYLVTYRTAHGVGQATRAAESYEVKIVERDRRLKYFMDNRYQLLSLVGDANAGYAIEEDALNANFVVHRMSNGGFAKCGCPARDSEGDSDKLLRT